MAEMTQKILSVEIDASKAIDGIVSLNNAIDANNKQMALNKQAIKENNEAMKESGADTQALADKNEMLRKANESLAIETKELASEKRALQKEVQNEIRANSQAEGSLKSLRAQLSNLTKQYDSLSKAERQNEQVGGALLRQINSVTTEIKTAEEETQRYFRNVGNYPETAESVKGALRSMQDEIINLTMEYRNMSAEMQDSEAGQAMKQRIEELTQKASEYKDAMNDVKQSIREGASDTRGLDTAIQAGQTLAATFGLANNAAVALGISTDGLQRAMLKMQQAMQAVQALQVIQNALQKQSNLMRGIGVIQAKAAAAAEALNAKILAQQTGATIAQTIAQRVFNAVAKANPYILLATAILTVIGLVVGYTDALGDNTEAQEDNSEAAQKSADAQKQYQEALRIVNDESYKRQKVEADMAGGVAQSVSKQLANYTFLQKKWKECGDDIKKQQQFLIDYKDELNNTGFAIKNVYDAQNVLVKQSGNVIKMYYALAEAAGAAAAAQDAFQRKIERKGKPTHENGGLFYYPLAGRKKDSLEKDALNYLVKIGGDIGTKNPYFTTGMGYWGNAYYVLNKAGEEELKKFYNKKANETRAALDAAEDAVIAYATEVESKSLALAKSLQGEIGTAFNGGGGGGGASPSRGGGRGGNRGGGSNKNNTQNQAKDAEYFVDRLVDMQKDAYQKMADEDDKYTELWKLKQIRAIIAKEQYEHRAIAEQYDNDKKELDKSLAAKKINQAQYNYFLDELGKRRADKDKIARNDQIEAMKKLYDEIANYQKQKDKEAADALAKEQERVKAQVQTMLDSMPEGSRGQMQWRLTQLAMQMQEELKMWENNEQMKVAIQKKYEQESEQVMMDYIQRQTAMQQQKYEAFGKIAGGLSQIFGEFAEESKEAAILQKTLATAEVMLAQAVAIANAIKAAAMGSINPWQMIAQIATSVTAVTIAMVQAFKSLDKAKFATGGYIGGAGTGTSDSIPVRVSNGESIINANSTAMFSGLLSALNQLGGGVPIQATSTAQSVDGEDMLARAFARGVAMLPNPVVSVVDINNGQRQVEVMNERATL